MTDFQYYFNDNVTQLPIGDITLKNNHLLTERKFINYDFGKNWKLFEPHLAEFLDVYREQVRQYRKEDEEEREELEISDDFMEDRISPAEEFIESDWFVTFMDEIFENLREHREVTPLYKATSRVPESLWIAYEDLISIPDDLQIDDQIMTSLEKIQEAIMILSGYDYFYNKTFIGFWIAIGNCFNWNATFGAYMAKIIKPENNWVIVQNSYHVSVVSFETGEMFDILLWATSNLWDFLLREPYSVPDNGAQTSIDMLMKDKHRQSSVACPITTTRH